jgi:DNA-binding NarL/FixJ family response regulator
MSTGDIAQKLFLTRATVRSHISAIMRKLDAPNRQSVLRMFEGDQSAAA